MEPRLTAQLAISDTEALLAYSIRNEDRRLNGERQIAALLHTLDAGQTWSQLPLRRTIVSYFHWGLPTWPPEAILELSLAGSEFQIVFRDEWVPFARGGESLWRASRRQNGKWALTRIRYMDYEGKDSPASIDGITLELPESIKGLGSDFFTESAGTGQQR